MTSSEMWVKTRLLCGKVKKHANICKWQSRRLPWNWKKTREPKKNTKTRLWQKLSNSRKPFRRWNKRLLANNRSTLDKWRTNRRCMPQKFKDFWVSTARRLPPKRRLIRWELPLRNTLLKKQCELRREPMLRRWLRRRRLTRKRCNLSRRHTWPKFKSKMKLTRAK